MNKEIQGTYNRAEKICPGIVERAEKKQEEMIKFVKRGKHE